jgi:hypothetical protein
MKTDTPISLTLGLVNGILQYLGTRPYAEVFPLVQEIQAQAMPQVPVPAPTPESAGLSD